MIRSPLFRCSAIVLWSSLASTAAFAHGAHSERVTEAPAEVVRFSYTAGQAMDGARIRVRMPETQQVFQVGRTDAQGQFAFVPDRPGNWIVEADDERGHKLEATVAVGASAAAAEEEPERVVVPRQILMWALLGSLLANAGLISALIGAKKRTP